jgi:hypothetical protein
MRFPSGSRPFQYRFAKESLTKTLRAAPRFPSSSRDSNDRPATMGICMVSK